MACDISKIGECGAAIDWTMVWPHTFVLGPGRKYGGHLH